MKVYEIFIHFVVCLKVAEYIKTRSRSSIRSHAQKYFIKCFRDNIPLPPKVQFQYQTHTLSSFLVFFLLSLSLPWGLILIIWERFLSRVKGTPSQANHSIHSRLLLFNTSTRVFQFYFNTTLLTIYFHVFFVILSVHLFSVNVLNGSIFSRHCVWICSVLSRTRTSDTLTQKI